MIITFSGAPGSGKSTVAEWLAKKLAWPRYYMGGIMRQMAAKRGLTIAGYNKLCEHDPEADLEVDNYLKELGQKNENCIIEGRTAWHFIPQSLKIYINVSIQVAAERIFKERQSDNQRNEGEKPVSIEEVLASIKDRIASEDFRYRTYYQIDYRNPENYDLYLDTSNLSREQVFQKVFDYVIKYLDNKKN